MDWLQIASLAVGPVGLVGGCFALWQAKATAKPDLVEKTEAAAGKMMDRLTVSNDKLMVQVRDLTDALNKERTSISEKDRKLLDISDRLEAVLSERQSARKLLGEVREISKLNNDGRADLLKRINNWCDSFDSSHPVREKG